MRLSTKQRQFTYNVSKLIKFAYRDGLELTFGEVWRSNDEQKRLVEVGLSKVDHSNHQDRLAVDFNLFIDGKYITDKEKYRPLGEYWETLGGRWGGRFGVKESNYDTQVGWDAGHFEYKG